MSTPNSAHWSNAVSWTRPRAPGSPTCSPGPSRQPDSHRKPLIHTDAGPGNTVLTPAGCAIPIDLESACVAPVDLELEDLFRNLHYLSEQTAVVQFADIAADLLDKPGAGARLRGYAILRDLWALRLWLRRNRDAVNLSTCPPIQRLHSHADGTSWLRNIL